MSIRFTGLNLLGKQISRKRSVLHLGNDSSKLTAVGLLSLLIAFSSLVGCSPKKETTLSGSFSTMRVITGYTLPVNASTIQSEDVVLTVTPKAAAATVQVVIIGMNRTTVVNVRRNPAAGTVTFNLKGSSQTPVNKPNGDTQVVARAGRVDLAQASVIVVIPTAVGTPHPTFDGTVTGKNILMDAGTSPAFFGILPPGHVKFATVYQTELNIPVHDQFGMPLNRIYTGTPVTERNGFAINQNMRANGTYRDPVGLVLIRRNSTPRVTSPGVVNPALNQFLNGPISPSQAFTENQTKLVQVGGHGLNPAISGRIVVVTPDSANAGRANLKITWP